MTSAPPPARVPPATVPPSAGPVPGIGWLPALLATAVLGLVLGALALAVAGPRALTGVLVGTGIVAAFFCLGAATVSAVAARVPPLAFLVALLTYTLQVVLLAAAFVALDRSSLVGQLDREWLAGTVVAGALAWSAALVGHALRSVPRSPPTEGEPRGEAVEGPADQRGNG